MSNAKDIEFKKGSKAAKFESIAMIDDNGFCEEVPEHVLKQHDIAFGNGADWCRNDGRFCKKYIVCRRKEGNKIVGVSTHGYRK